MVTPIDGGTHACVMPVSPEQHVYGTPECGTLTRRRDKFKLTCGSLGCAVRAVRHVRCASAESQMVGPSCAGCSPACGKAIPYQKRCTDVSAGVWNGAACEPGCCKGCCKLHVLGRLFRMNGPFSSPKNTLRQKCDSKRCCTGLSTWRRPARCSTRSCPPDVLPFRCEWCTPSAQSRPVSIIECLGLAVAG